MTTLITSDEQRVADLCDQLLAEHDPKTTPAAEFLGAQFDLGLGWVHFPVGHGGLGLSPKLGNIVSQRLSGGRRAVAVRDAIPSATACARRRSSCTVPKRRRSATCGRCSPAKRSGASCSASRVPVPTSPASRRARSATATSGRSTARRCGRRSRTCRASASCSPRTNPDAVKHKGMTMFVIDMHAPGVEVRPLMQATGEAEFNEVYMTDVRIPDSERLGDVGEGWGVSLTTLMNERVLDRRTGRAARQRHHRDRAEGVEGEPQPRRPGRRASQLAQFWIEAEVNRLTNMRAAQSRVKGTPGPEGSVGKMAMAGLNQRLMSFVVDLLGPDGDALPDRLPDGPADHRDGPLEHAEGVPARAGQLDRGRHHQHHEEHPRRARPRPARRAPGRQGRPLEPGPAQLRHVRPIRPAGAGVVAWGLAFGEASVVS